MKAGAGDGHKMRDLIWASVAVAHCDLRRACSKLESGQFVVTHARFCRRTSIIRIGGNGEKRLRSRLAVRRRCDERAMALAHAGFTIQRLHGRPMTTRGAGQLDGESCCIVLRDQLTWNGRS